MNDQIKISKDDSTFVLHVVESCSFIILNVSSGFPAAVTPESRREGGSLRTRRNITWRKHHVIRSNDYNSHDATSLHDFNKLVWLKMTHCVVQIIFSDLFWPQRVDGWILSCVWKQPSCFWRRSLNLLSGRLCVRLMEIT